MNKKALTVTLEVVLFSIQHEQLMVYLEDNQRLPHCVIDQVHDKTLESAILKKINQLDLPTISYLEQVKTIGDADRLPDMWSLAVIYFGFIGGVDEDQSSTWVPVKTICKHPSALTHDHAQIIIDSLHRLQNKALYTSLPALLLPKEFTLSELQKAYEIVLGFKIEKKSFRRRMQDANVLIETQKVRHANHRPAQVYRLAHTEPHIFNRIIEGERG